MSSLLRCRRGRFLIPLLGLLLVATGVTGPAAATGTSATAGARQDRTEAEAPERRGMVPEDYYRFRFVSEPRVSPDGSRVAFVVGVVADDRRSRETSVWTVPADGSAAPRRFTAGPSDRSPRWSPEGDRLAFLGRREGDERTRVYVIPVDGGEARPVTDLGVDVDAFEWLPDGDSLLLILRTEEGRDPRAEANGEAASGEANGEAATGEADDDRGGVEGPDRGGTRAGIRDGSEDREPGGGEDPASSQDPEPDVVRVRDPLYKRNGVGYLDDRRAHLWRLELGSGRLSQLTGGSSWNDANPTVSPDGGWIVFDSDRTGEEYEGGSNDDLWLVPSVTAEGSDPVEPVQLTTHPHRDVSPVWSPAGEAVAYLRTEEPYDQPDVWLLPAAVGEDGDVDVGEPRNLTADFDRIPRSLEWAPDGTALYFTADDQGAHRPFRLDVASGEVDLLFDVGASVGDPDASPDGAGLVFTLEDETRLPEVAWLAVDYDEGDEERGRDRDPIEGPAARRLTDLNGELLGSLQLMPLEEVWFTNDAGGRVQGFLMRPVHGAPGERGEGNGAVGRDETEEPTAAEVGEDVRERAVTGGDGVVGERLSPLVLDIKGGPGGMWGHRWFHEFQMLAAAGYAVGFVNYRGSTGYGIEHQGAVRLDYGGVDYRDNLRFVDELLERHAWIDPERLGVTGGSHGGFLTNWITTQTDRFRAAVTQRSVASWISEAGTQEYTPRQMREEFGGTLWENFELYWDRSPLKFADRVTTPTLVIHSEGDMITPVGQGQAWYYALVANDVPAELAIFEGEDHDLSRTGTPVNLVERLRLILEWFDRHLRPSEEP